MLKDCSICPRRCRVDRSSGQTGACRTGKFALVSSYAPHFGEESPLVGKNGSGTIFFTHCNLQCIFCQNFDISHLGNGQAVSDETLARIMLELQAMGCHNINLVSPSHVVPQILTALESAVQEGLKIPLVYNSGGYDRVETLALLEEVVDIYMPDFKIWDPGVAEKACGAADYPEIARNALLEMHRQVGDLESNSEGVAVKGLLIRHLVLPGGLAGTRPIMTYIAERISRDSYVNVMSQYRPCGRAHEIEELAEPLSVSEFKAAVEIAVEAGLRRLDRPGRFPLQT
jgi:putative pyruvate formate lyase activating enzyme